jgi:hypothetical protein
MAEESWGELLEVGLGALECLGVYGGEREEGQGGESGEEAGGESG